MSNRRKTARERMIQRYKNAGRGPAIRTDGNGNAVRGEGRNNFPYGPRPGARRSILTLHARLAKRAAAEPEPVDYESMTRDGLRAVAKGKGLTGYGRMNKAELIAAVSA